MRRQLAVLVALAFLVAACGVTSTPPPSSVVTAEPIATPALSATASGSSNASTEPFAGKPYTLAVPDGWKAFDLSNPASKAALNTFVQVNPAFAAGVQAFESTPNVWLAVNPLLGNALVVLPIGSQGLALDTIGRSLTAQFLLVPGLASPPPVAQPTSLPGGDALHWDMSLTANKAGGGTVHVEESVYLFVSAQTAVIVEFVTPGGGVRSNEATIIQSFRFRP